MLGLQHTSASCHSDVLSRSRRHTQRVHISSVPSVRSREPKELLKLLRVRGYAIGSGTERPGETLSCTSETWSPSKLLSPELAAEEGGMLTRIVKRGTQNGIVHGRPCSGRRAWRIFPGRTSQAPSFTPSCDIIASLFAYSLAFPITNDPRDTCSDATDHLHMTTR